MTMQRRLSSNLIAFLFAALASLASAQSGSSPSLTPNTVLHVDTRLVYVDAIVRDAEGHILRGLSKDDFRVAEDGKPRPIVFFQSHLGSPIIAGSDRSAVNTPDTSNALNILLFDLLDTPLLDQAYARQQMLRFLTNLPPGHQVALFVLSNRLHMVQGYTGRSDLLAEAARLLDPQEMHRTRDGARAARDQEDVAYVDSQIGRSPRLLGQAIQQAIYAEDVQHLVDSASAVNQAFAQIGQSLSRYSGRKNLFWLSSTFPFAVPGFLETLSPDMRAAVGNSDSALRVLADSQIAVYPISLTGVEVDAAGAESRGPSDGVAAFNRRTTQHFAMNEIADRTGGEAIYGTNDIAAALNRALVSGANYYTIAYQPPKSSGIGDLHHISLSVPGRYVRLAYRHSYYAEPADADRHPTAELASVMTPFAPPSNELGLTATAADAGGATSMATVQARLNLGAVGFTMDQKGLRHAQLFLVIAGFSPGQDRAAPQAQDTALLRFALDDQEYAKMVKAGGLPFEQHLALPPGPHRLRLGVVDLTNDRVGTVDLNIDLPAIGHQ